MCLLHAYSFLLDISKRFHKFCIRWQKKLFENAITWYNLSWSMFSLGVADNENLAKLHRNRGDCFLSLGQLEKVQ